MANKLSMHIHPGSGFYGFYGFYGRFTAFDHHGQIPKSLERLRLLHCRLVLNFSEENEAPMK